MKINFKNYSFQFWLIQISYLFLFIISILFFKHRLASDTCYYFFKTLNNGTFHIEHQRLVLAFAELPVYLFSKFGFTLKNILILFSLWHYLFFYLIGLFIYKKYNNYYGWLILLLLQIVGIINGFVNPIFEQFYGTALAILFYFIITSNKKLSISNIIFSSILFIIVLLSHPFNSILLIYILCLDFLKDKNIKKLLPFLFLIPLYIIFKKIYVSSYESDKINWIFNLKYNKTYLELLQAKHLKSKLLFFCTYYFDVIIIFFLCIFYFLKTKQHKYFWIYTSFFLFALALINFCYSIESFAGYTEQVYYLIVPITLLPFILIIIPQLKNQFIKATLNIFLFSLICIRVFIIINYANCFKAKYIYANQLITKTQNKDGCKFYITTNNLDTNNQFVNWDMPFYCILISALNNYPKQVTIFPAEENIQNIINTNDNQYWFRINELKIQTQ